MEERSSKYQIEISRNGKKVPVVNGVYLHSIYNPIKEAEAFSEEHGEKLRSKNLVLVLGLGFGYHIDEIEKKLKDAHGDNYQIQILEPSSQMVNHFNREVGFTSKHVSIIKSASVEDIFSSWDVVSFLMKKPLILKHDSSFSLEKKYFTEFLSYKAPIETNKIATLLTEASANLISGFNSPTLPDLMRETDTLNKFGTKESYLLKAFNHICHL